MRSLTIQEVIKALPIDFAFMQKLLKAYEVAPNNVKFEIMHASWKAFHQMERAMKEAKYEEFTQEVAAGKRKFTPDFMQQVDDAVWQEIEDAISGSRHVRGAIEDVRRQLEAIISGKVG